jgi:hypothetical protein
LKNPKSTTFSPLVLVLSPQEIGAENSRKKAFFGFCTGPNTLFMDLKKISKIFGCIWYLLVLLFNFLLKQTARTIGPLKQSKKFKIKINYTSFFNITDNVPSKKNFKNYRTRYQIRGQPLFIPSLFFM